MTVEGGDDGCDRRLLLGLQGNGKSQLVLCRHPRANGNPEYSALLNFPLPGDAGISCAGMVW